MRVSSMVLSAAVAVAALVPVAASAADLEYDRQACRPGTRWDGYACVPVRPPVAYAPAPQVYEQQVYVEPPPVYVAPYPYYAAPVVSVYAGPRYYYGPRYYWGPRRWAAPRYAAWGGAHRWRR
jgi:hypothetical protein